MLRETGHAVPERKLVPGEKVINVSRETVTDLRVCEERNGIADVLLPVSHGVRRRNQTLTILISWPLDPPPTCCAYSSPLLRPVHVGLAVPDVQLFHLFILLFRSHLVIAALSRTITVSRQVVSPTRSIFVSPLSSKATFSYCSYSFHQV